MRIPLLLLLLSTICAAFVPGATSSHFGLASPSVSTGKTTTPTASSLSGSPSDIELNLSSAEEKVYDFCKTLHKSGYVFRTIVAGSSGAILESTQPLGSVIKLNESAKSGDLFLTMASDDQSFEFHIKIRLVGKIVLVERELPGKTLRIIRMMNQEEESMCSLILADYSEEAGTWFQESLVAKYGNEITVT